MLWQLAQHRAMGRLWRHAVVQYAVRVPLPLPAALAITASAITAAAIAIAAAAIAIAASTAASIAAAATDPAFNTTNHAAVATAGRLSVGCERQRERIDRVLQWSIR